MNPCFIPSSWISYPRFSPPRSLERGKVKNMNWMFKNAEAFSYYPKGWVIPAEQSTEMFEGSKLEAAPLPPLSMGGIYSVSL